jgi:N-sulfoglucosamine sulfohydrolase
MTEILKANGYYQGVTHKLHVLPNEKFPYDEFLHGHHAQLNAFINSAKVAGKPWFLLVNIPDSHRPYPNSDKHPIRVNPAEVHLPDYLPDTSVIRKDWAEYLAGIEQVDTHVGQALDALDASGEADHTIVIYMSDHGPTFQHGKMTLYDLGLRVPLAFCGPGINSGCRSSALASELDLLPTLLDLIEGLSDEPLNIPFQPNGQSHGRLPYAIDGVSLAGILTGKSDSAGHEYIFAEISNRGPLPNDGIQERSVFDGRWKLIYRENVAQNWRQVNADSRLFKTWGNRTYAETIRVKNQFPAAYRVLAEMDPQNLGGPVRSIELYDLKKDPDEMQNLAESPVHRGERVRLVDALRRWAVETNDISIRLAANN